MTRLLLAVVGNSANISAPQGYLLLKLREGEGGGGECGRVCHSQTTCKVHLFLSRWEEAVIMERSGKINDENEI